MQEVFGWGRWPRIQADVRALRTVDEVCALAKASAQSLLSGQTSSRINRGLGRSYGDSSLAEHVETTTALDHFVRFDQSSGLLECEAGTSLAEILSVFVPRGWFLPVTPGTRFVTIGGAIASDVHGKNHHVDGSFTRHVESIDMVLGNGECVRTSPSEHPDLFRATGGGMGLTGTILRATLRLMPIRSSRIVETTLKMPTLDAVLDAFDANAAARYSVAWIDCLASGAKLGRSLLMLGEHAEDGLLQVQQAAPRPVPLDIPPAMLNGATVGAFNALYYARVRQPRQVRTVPFEPYFYPLDALAHWNRLYGRPGFLQYQFALPRAAGRGALREIIRSISESGRGSFLAVLKAFGTGNDHPLSFPAEGWTLALDFKAEPAVFELLDRLDAMVLAHGGRLYLAKDARMKEATFKAGYPQWEQFEAIRERYHAIGAFASLQSRRLGLR